MHVTYVTWRKCDKKLKQKISNFLPDKEGIFKISFMQFLGEILVVFFKQLYLNIIYIP